MKIRSRIILSAFRLMAALLVSASFCTAADASDTDRAEAGSGGGYAATGQTDGMGYTSRIYDAANGLPTSDANYVLGAADGYIWIGSYSGILRYDGSGFSRVELSAALTNGRGLFEDSKGRIWVGTNDNGVVVIDGSNTVHFTYKDGLPSSSIRSFAEDSSGNIYIATTAGICYADTGMRLFNISDERLDGKRILKLDRGAGGTVFGYTKSGSVFAVENGRILACYECAELGMEKISTFMADRARTGMVYLCAGEGDVYYGKLGDKAEAMQKISAAPLSDIHWISEECGRIWIASTGSVGYLDEAGVFRLLDNLPVSSGIEMLTSDYQGNIWLASSTQGVMKITANSFVDLCHEAGLAAEVTNAACFHGGELYIGTDSGIRILDGSGKAVENALSSYLGDTRVRCLQEGKNGELWAATYTNDLGVVCYTADGRIFSLSEENGLPDNEVRCLAVKEDGTVLAGTNGGLAEIRGETVVRTAGAADGIENTVFITLEEGENGRIYAGTDGGGIYVIDGTEIGTIGRDNGLTSDVIMKIKKDAGRNLYWIITSNSIEYLKDGVLTNITTFPYNNNYDLQWNGDEMWVTSSHGLYQVNAEEMLRDKVTDYKVYSPENGLICTPTAHTYCVLDETGYLYIPGRSGVCRIRTGSSAETELPIKTAVSTVFCGDEQILPDSEGIFRLPASRDRIRITASVLDYSLMNPTVNIYMEGRENEGITVPLREMQPLEYTGLEYGIYTLHVRVLDSTGHRVLLDDKYTIDKAPSFSERPLIRALAVLAVFAASGFIMWWVMKMTVIRRQYEEIRHAKEDAETANTARTRFLANISHELLTPINTIAGVNEMAMREDAADVPKPYFMSMMNYCFDIRDASESLISMINDLLNISNIESGRSHLKEQEYDTADMLRSAMKKARERCLDKGLTFDVRIDELLPSRMFGDSDKITQILIHLLSNAVKFTDAGGITFSVSMLERENQTCSLQFSVKDTGRGLQAEELETVFSGFERLDEQRRAGKHGIGLGLEISHRFAALMGGTLTCESEYGKGAEFILTLTQKMIDQTPVTVDGNFTESSKRGIYVPQFIAPDADILVADDNPKSISIIKGLLRKTNVFVSSAANLSDCLEKIKDTRFHVVFIDHRMLLDADAAGTIEEIRRINPLLPVYVLTANPSAGEIPYTEKGFTGYLSKPVDGITLEHTILKHIPDAMKQNPSVGQASGILKEIPWDMLWLKDTEGISVTDGIRNSGGVQTFVFALRLFRDTVDTNTKVIRSLYESGSIRRLTVKLHSLSTAAANIGAVSLAAFAAELEAAGNRGDSALIDRDIEKLLSDYASYKEKLAKLHDTQSHGGEVSK